MYYKQLIKRSVQIGLRPVELHLVQKTYPCTYAPVFIIGPPRTGSTLLYQLLTRSYRFCYFSNFMMHFPAAALSTAKLASPWNGCNPPDNYASAYGETRGWNGPHQGKPFWDLWLPAFPHEVEPHVVATAAKHRIRNTVLGIQEAFQAPFVNKWPPNSLRLRLLAEIFPGALFIRITRQLEQNIDSIFRARCVMCPTEADWFSVKPRGYESVKLNNPTEQITWQINRINEVIERDSAAIGTGKFMTVNHEELIGDPRTALDKIARFYIRAGGTALEARNEIPPSFANTAKSHVSNRQGSVR